jgi:hypothetical protein
MAHCIGACGVGRGLGNSQRCLEVQQSKVNSKKHAANLGVSGCAVPRYIKGLHCGLLESQHTLFALYVPLPHQQVLPVAPLLRFESSYATSDRVFTVGQLPFFEKGNGLALENKGFSSYFLNSSASNINRLEIVLC